VHSENRRRGKNKTTGRRNRQNRDQLATAETEKLCLSLVSQRKYADCSSKTEETPSDLTRENKITTLKKLREGGQEREREREEQAARKWARGKQNLDVLRGATVVWNPSARAPTACCRWTNWHTV